MKKLVLSHDKAVHIHNKIIEYGIYILAFLVPIIYSNYFWAIYEFPKLTAIRLITLILTACFLFKIIKVSFFSFNRLDLPMFLFLSVCFFATLFSSNFTFSLFGSYPNGKGLIDVFVFVVLYFIVANNFKNKENIIILFFVSTMSSFAISMVGLYQYFTLDGRIFSTFPDPNYLGGYLAINIPFVFFLIFTLKRYLRIFFILILIIIILSLFLTYSRASYLAFITSSIVFIFYLAREKKINRKIILTGFVAVVLIFTGVLISKEKIRDNLFREKSVIIRVFMWRDTLYMIKDNFILGVGLNNFKVNYYKYKSKEYAKEEAEDVIPDTPHNEILEIASTMGVVGLFSYLWLGIAILGTALRLINKENKEKILISSTFASFIAYFTNNLFGYSHIVSLFYFFILAGIISGFDLNKKYFLRLTKLSLFIIYFACMFLVFVFLFFIKLAVSDIYFKKGVKFSKENYFEESIKMCNKAISLNNKRDEYYVLLGDIYLTFAQKKENEEEKNKLFEKAISSIEKALEISPDDPLYFYALGRAYNIWGKSDEAIYNFELSLEGDMFNPETCYQLGMLYLMEKGNLQKSEEFFKKAIDIKPSFVDAYLGLANVYYNKNMSDTAIKQVKRAIEISPKDANIYYFLAKLYLKKGEIELAKKELLKVIKLSTDYELSQKAQKELNELSVK